MPDPIVTKLATQAAGKLVSLLLPRMKEVLLGRDEQRAVERAMQTAVSEVLGNLPRDGAGERDTILRRVLEDAVVAGALLDDAFGHTPLDPVALQLRLGELGVDVTTFPADLGTLMADLADAIHQAIEDEGRRPTSPLFNMLVLDRLDRLTEVRPTVARVAPPPPGLLIGRDRDLDLLKRRLGIGVRKAESTVQLLTAVRGWPGVGKTTVTAALVHDADVATAFPDGVLWASATDGSRIRSELAGWATALRGNEPDPEQTTAQLSAEVAGLLTDRRMLIVVDDVWEPGHARALLVGGRGCATLVTTREPAVADALAPTEDSVHPLPVLDRDAAVRLIAEFVPGLVNESPERVDRLVRRLEYLPLALCVAGRLLRAEIRNGWGVVELLEALDDGADLLATRAPSDRTNLAEMTVPSVGALLRQSTDRLAPSERELFACLGAFAERPATFDEPALSALWELPAPRPVVRTMIARGLLEHVGGGRYWMHALLALHARELLAEMGG